MPYQVGRLLGIKVSSVMNGSLVLVGGNGFELVKFGWCKVKGQTTNTPQLRTHVRE